MAWGEQLRQIIPDGPDGWEVMRPQAKEIVVALGEMEAVGIPVNLQAVTDPEKQVGIGTNLSGNGQQVIGYVVMTRRENLLYQDRSLNPLVNFDGKKPIGVFVEAAVLGEKWYTHQGPLLALPVVDPSRRQVEVNNRLRKREVEAGMGSIESTLKSTEAVYQAGMSLFRWLSVTTERLLPQAAVVLGLTAEDLEEGIDRLEADLEARRQKLMGKMPKGLERPGLEKKHRLDQPKAYVLLRYERGEPTFKIWAVMVPSAWNLPQDHEEIVRRFYLVDP